MTDLLTVAQVAARLGVSRQRVHAFIQAGRLPATKLGRDWLIAPAGLAALDRRPIGRPRK